VAGIEDPLDQNLLIVVGPITRASSRMTVGKEDFAERSVFAQREWLQRSRLQSQQPAIGAVYIAAADRHDSPSHPHQAVDSRAGVHFPNGKHVNDNVWRWIGYAGWKVQHRDTGVRAVDVTHFAGEIRLMQAAVIDGDGVTLAMQFGDQVRANEVGPADDQNPHSPSAATVPASPTIRPRDSGRHQW
jgi:hypothetical protein